MVGDRPLFDAWTLDTVKHPALWPPADDTVMSSAEAAEWLWSGVDASAFTSRAVVDDEWASHRAGVVDDDRVVASWGAESEMNQW